MQNKTLLPKLPGDLQRGEKMLPSKFRARQKWICNEERRVQEILDREHEAAIDFAAETGRAWSDKQERNFWKKAEVRREKLLADSAARFEEWYAEQTERDAGYGDGQNVHNQRG